MLALILLVSCAGGADSPKAGSVGSSPGGSSSVGSSSASPSTLPSTSIAPDFEAAPDSTAQQSTKALIESVCDGTARVTDAGVIGAPEITEASGLAASRASPGVWWTHNDSGHKPELFAIDETGALLATVTITNADSFDWEDIAVGTGSDGGERLYIGDIGSAREDRTTISVYVLSVPSIFAANIPTGAGESAESGESAGSGESAVEPQRISAAAERIDLTFPDEPMDAEALMVDPRTSDIYIIDKDWTLLGNSHLYRVPGNAIGSRRATLENVAQLQLGSGTLVTGADVSVDGSAIAIRSYGGVQIYRRSAGQSVADALMSDGCSGPSPDERQGEAIGFSADGGYYMTLSEGSDQTLHRTALNPDG